MYFTAGFVIALALCVVPEAESCSSLSFWQGWASFRTARRCSIPPPPPHEGLQCRMATQEDYYFDSNTRTCVNAPWSPCMPRGEGSGFKTQEECETSCIEEPEPEQQKMQSRMMLPGPDMTSRCALAYPPPHEGPKCHMKTKPDFYYDSKTGRCNNAPWSSCMPRGEGKGFKTLKECEKTCYKFNRCALTVPPTHRGPQCRMATQPDYYYDEKTKKCVNAPWSACMPRGEGRGFWTQQECESSCSKATPMIRSVNEACNLPSEPGMPGTGMMCLAYIPAYYFDMNTGKCAQFVFGGCGGNTNRWASLEECEKNCVQPGISTTGTGVSYSLPGFCNLSPEVGRCKAKMVRYHYSNEQGKCVQFSYGGCDGNKNNFLTLEECQQACS